MSHVLRRPAARPFMVVAGTVAVSLFVVPCSVHSATSPCGRRAGHWVVSAEGAVYPAGDARSFGSVSDLDLSAPIVAPTPTGRGYWLLTADGTALGFGDAHGRVPVIPARAGAATRVAVGMVASHIPFGGC